MADNTTGGSNCNDNAGGFPSKAPPVSLEVIRALCGPSQPPRLRILTLAPRPPSRIGTVFQFVPTLPSANNGERREWPSWAEVVASDPEMAAVHERWVSDPELTTDYPAKGSPSTEWGWRRPSTERSGQSPSPPLQSEGGSAGKHPARGSPSTGNASGQPSTGRYGQGQGRRTQKAPSPALQSEGGGAGKHPGEPNVPEKEGQGGREANESGPQGPPDRRVHNSCTHRGDRGTEVPLPSGEGGGCLTQRVGLNTEVEDEGGAQQGRPHPLLDRGEVSCPVAAKAAQQIREPYQWAQQSPPPLFQGGGLPKRAPRGYNGRPPPERGSQGLPANHQRAGLSKPWSALVSE